MNLGQKIARLRDGLKLSQEELARLADMTLGGLQRIEVGRIKDPGWFTVGRIAGALGVSLDRLAAGVKPAEDGPRAGRKRRGGQGASS